MVCMNTKKFKTYLLTILLSLPLVSWSGESSPTAPASNEHVVRAAIDIGSGATKLKVAKINLNTQKIETVLVNESFSVQYQEELEKSPDGTFNDQVMKTGLETLKKSLEIAQKHGAEKVVAVATASFRNAANVQDFIDQIYRETDIKVHIIDQHLEGALGFQAATAQVSTDPSNVVVWDIGGGSYQFTTLDRKGNVIVHRGIDASIPFKNHVIKEIKKEDLSKTSTPNPLSNAQRIDAQKHAVNLSKKVDNLFKKKIRHPDTKVVGIGNIFAYGVHPLVGKKSTFTQKDLHEKVQCLEGKKDHDLGSGAYANVAVTNPILVLGFMQTLGIDQMDIIDINNADGALLHPLFWEEA